jgi:hypothetical protein
LQFDRPIRGPLRQRELDSGRYEGRRYNDDPGRLEDGGSCRMGDIVQIATAKTLRSPLSYCSLRPNQETKSYGKQSRQTNDDYEPHSPHATAFAEQTADQGDSGAGRSHLSRPATLRALTSRSWLPESAGSYLMTTNALARTSATWPESSPAILEVGSISSLVIRSVSLFDRPAKPVRCRR